VLRAAAQDFLPETRAAAQSINGWLADNPAVSGDRASRYLGQNDGKSHFVVRGQSFETGAQPYRFFQLQIVQDAYKSCDDAERAGIETMLDSCGLQELLTIELDRRLEQRDNLEVWV